MTVRAAIIGCGLIGTKRARALTGAGAEVVAVHDVDAGRAKALAESIGPAVLVADSAGAACAHGVDIAVVATTHRALAPSAIEAIEAGSHVLLEKPGACDVDELRGVAALAVRDGRQVRMGYNHRFHPSFLEAHRVIASGDFGRVMNIRARYGHGGRLGYEQEWRADRALSGGGELLDQGVHLIDLTRSLVGDVSLAFSELATSFWATQVEDNAFLALRAESGAFAWLHASWTEWKNLFSFEIALERAKLEIEGLGGSYGTERLTVHEMLPELGPPVTRAWEWPRPDESWAREVDDVLGALDGQPTVGASIDDGIAALAIVKEAYSR